MAEKSGFFDAHFVNGEYDRVYLAEHFARYFASFIGNGIFGGKSNELMVREKEPASMSIRVLSGQAWIDGYWYENDGEHSLTIDVADGVLHRIDSIVVRWVHAERTIRLAVRKGAAATNPTAPSVQRNDDFYELKLADISVRAGTTKITQADITDKRLNTNECGLVIGVVQQLDPDEFGIQLETYISEFIAEHDSWKNATQSDIEQWANEFKASYTNWFTQFKADCNAAVNALLTENQTRIDKLVSDGQTSIANVVSKGTTDINNLLTEKGTAFDNMIDAKTAEANQVISEGRQAFDSIIDYLEEQSANVDLVKFNQDIAELKALSTESSQYPGCFYRIINGSTEWINPPSMPGVEYMTTERWNGNPVYQTMIYAAALPNKTVMSVHVNSYFDEIISITGFAIDSDNNMHYQFPIILNGLTPAAVISFAEGDGGDGSDITINTNDDLSSFKAYVTVKYTKRVRG